MRCSLRLRFFGGGDCIGLPVQPIKITTRGGQKAPALFPCGLARAPFLTRRNPEPRNLFVCALLLGVSERETRRETILGGSPFSGWPRFFLRQGYVGRCLSTCEARIETYLRLEEAPVLPGVSVPKWLGFSFFRRQKAPAPFDLLFFSCFGFPLIVKVPKDERFISKLGKAQLKDFATRRPRIFKPIGVLTLWLFL